MKIILALCAALLLCCATAHAQNAMNVTACGAYAVPAGVSPPSQDANGNGCEATRPAQLTALGYCQLAVTTAVGLSTCTNGLPASATIAYIVTETEAIRFRDDGTAPTATVGFPIATGAAPFIYSGPLSALKIISETSTATVDVEFYK